VLVAALLVALVLLLDAMAACPQLHEFFHKDANESEHQCAVTFFSHGQLDSVSIDIPISQPQVFVVTVPQVKLSFFAPAIENLPAGRAPPVSVSTSI
jgi:hypothetical protein